MPEFSSSTLEGLTSMEKPAHRGEPRFDFTQLENQEDLDEQMKYISSASSARTIHWPQSYERSMDLYSRSPPSVTGSNLLVPSEEKLQQHSSYHSNRVPKHNVSDVKLPLLDDRGFEWSKKEPYEGGSEVYEPQPEFQSQYVQDGDDHLQIGKSSLTQAIMNGVNALAGCTTMPEFSSSTLEGLRSMEKPAHRGEPRFDFTQLENQEDLEEQMKYISSASSARTIHWPQSYERSMDLYSRSPPSVTGSNLLVPSEEKLQQHSSYHSHRVPKHNVSDVMLPLLDDRGFEWSKKEPYEGASEVYEPQPEFQGQYVQDGDDNLQIGKSSLIQAIMNGVNALAGVGVLSTPYAVSQCGWIGLCFLLTFALVFCYTGFLLRRCLDLFPFLAGYPDVGQAAFGRLGRVLVSAFLYCELYAVAVEFLIMEGDNLSQLFPLRTLNLGIFELSSEKRFVIFSAAIMLPTVWLRDLSMLSYISAGGVIACVAVTVAVACTGTFEVGFPNHGRLVNFHGLPIAVGIYGFCFCGHAVFPNIYASMRNKSRFSHVLVACFLIRALIYGSIAVLGFLMFGDDSESQVTLNLTRGRLTTNIAIVATLVNPFSKYALAVTPLAAALEEVLPIELKSRTFLMWGTLIRTLIVLSTVIIALVLPFFGYLMALVGAFLSITVAITIPCLCYAKLFSDRIPLWERAFISLVLAVGLGSCVAGTYSSRKEIALNLAT